MRLTRQSPHWLQGTCSCLSPGLRRVKCNGPPADGWKAVIGDVHGIVRALEADSASHVVCDVDFPRVARGVAEVAGAFALVDVSASHRWVLRW